MNVPQVLLVASDVAGESLTKLWALIQQQLSTMKPEQAGQVIGYVSGLVLWEVAESVITLGATKVVKSQKALALVKKLEKVPGLNSPAAKQIIENLVFRLGSVLGTRMCFVAGTKIHTLEGLKNIEDIRTGDLVLTRFEESGVHDTRPVYKPVRAAFVTHPNELFQVRLREDSGPEETLVCTGGHPFYVVGRGQFVYASELAAGDQLALPEGRTASVLGSTRTHALPGETFTTYNFEVTDAHTYFVGEAGVWVHNSSDLWCTQAAAKFEKIKAKGSSAKAAMLEVGDWLDAARKANKLTDRQYAKHLADSITTVMEKGGLTLDEAKDVLEAWKRVPTLRGDMIEQFLARTEYKNWTHVGADNNGFGKGYDFSRKVVNRGYMADAISFKTTDPRLPNWKKTITDAIKDVVNTDSIPDGTRVNTRIIDIRVPKDTLASIQSTVEEFKERGELNRITILFSEF